VVVEDRYSEIFKLDRVRPALVADGIAECQVRWPTIPIVFCDTRPLAEEWTYRYLAAAHAWAAAEPAAIARIYAGVQDGRASWSTRHTAVPRSASSRSRTSSARAGAANATSVRPRRDRFLQSELHSFSVAGAGVPTRCRRRCRRSRSGLRGA
jgi:hypothetical protein